MVWLVQDHRPRVDVTGTDTAAVVGYSGGVSTPEAETVDASDDHHEIRDAIRAVSNHRVGTTAWYEAVDQ